MSYKEHILELFFNVSPVLSLHNYLFDFMESSSTLYSGHLISIGIDVVWTSNQNALLIMRVTFFVNVTDIQGFLPLIEQLAVTLAPGVDRERISTNLLIHPNVAVDKITLLTDI